jgi:outer membrane receptor protein involved in Fe transport
LSCRIRVNTTASEIRRGGQRHLPLLSSVNVGDSPLQGIKVNSYELGWRYTGDNLRTQLAAYYSTSDKTIVVNRTDMTIDVQSDKRRIYGVEGRWTSSRTATGAPVLTLTC